MKKESYPLSSAIENAYKNSEILVFETDIESMNDPAFQVKMMAFGMYQDGSTLKKKIPEKLYSQLQEKMNGYGLNLAQFDLFKPWFCAIAISMAELKKLGFDETLGIDNFFFNRAKQDHKKRSFFETNEFQLNLFSAMEQVNQALFLEQTLKDIEIIETLFSEIMNYWTNGDAEKLGMIINKSFLDYPAIYERFITARNNTWLPKIEGLLRQDKNVFIIAGAGHLVGEQGIIKMLKERGYKIEQQ